VPIKQLILNAIINKERSLSARSIVRLGIERKRHQIQIQIAKTFAHFGPRSGFGHDFRAFRGVFGFLEANHVRLPLRHGFHDSKRVQTLEPQFRKAEIERKAQNSVEEIAQVRIRSLLFLPAKILGKSETFWPGKTGQRNGAKSKNEANCRRKV